MKKVLSVAHPDLGAFLLFRASGHGLGQVEVLPGIRWSFEWALAAEPEHRAGGEVDEHYVTRKVRGEHALAEVVQDGVERSTPFFEPVEGVLQLRGHGVEGPCEFGELVVEAGFDPLGEVAPLDGAGPRDEPLDAPAQQRGKEERDSPA